MYYVEGNQIVQQFKPDKHHVRSIKQRIYRDPLCGTQQHTLTQIPIVDLSNPLSTSYCLLSKLTGISHRHGLFVYTRTRPLLSLLLFPVEYYLSYTSQAPVIDCGRRTIRENNIYIHSEITVIYICVQARISYQETRRADTKVAAKRDYQHTRHCGGGVLYRLYF